MEDLQKLICSNEWRQERNIPLSRPMSIISIDGDYFQTKDIFGNTRWWKCP